MDLIKSESSTGSSDAGHGSKKAVNRMRKHRQKKKRANENLATDESNGAGAVRIENPNVEETKKPIVSLAALAKAAEKIDPSHLEDYLERYLLQELQLLRFCVHLNEAFSQVSIPWVKMFKESTLSTLIDVPLSHIPKPVYDVSNKWIKDRTIEKLCEFVSLAGGCIVADMEAQQGGGKGRKKGAQQTSSKSEVGTFVALAMVLRTRPDALITVLRMLRERPTYQGEDKLPFIVWMMAQASQGDLSAGLYAWAHNLLPVLGDKNKCHSPESMDLILQFVENLLSNPEARAILVNNAVREGERLIPLASFEILLRLTFPDPSARTKATERFEAIYPLLKEVALAPTGSNTMKQIFTISLKLAGQGNPVLAKEATAIAVWSLTKNADCFKLWDIVYAENLDASVALLKKLLDEWKDHSIKLSSSPRDTLTVSQTMKSFRQKNEKAITEGGADCSLYKEADKSCQVISGRVDRGSGRRFTDITALVIGASGAAIGAAGVTFVVVGLKYVHGYSDCLMCL